MKHIVSVSLGSRKRDHQTETELLGTKILIERRGVDGDPDAARKMLRELDGKVDAFGLGGAEFGVNIGTKYYPIRAVSSFAKGLNTPIVDGTGIRKVIEGNMAKWLLERLPDEFRSEEDRRVFFCVASGRYDLVESFYRSKFTMKFGDAGFILGLPMTTQSLAVARFFASVYVPMIVRLPFRWLYPTGTKQEQIKPKFKNWYRWAKVIADDFHYIRKHLPDDLSNKIIVTNTTTAEDVEMLRQRGAKILCTTTPMFDGRSYGTNVLEATLTAVAGQGRALSTAEIEQIIKKLKIEPTINWL